MSRCSAAKIAVACAAVLLLGACSSATQGMKEPGDAALSIVGGPCGGMPLDDRSAPSSDRTVSFGGAGTSGPFSYAPMCMRVAKGQTVTFSGDFSVHPLQPGLAPGLRGTATANSPIRATTSGQQPASVTFASPGTFPYFCAQHYAGGMVGAVEVTE